LHHGSSEFERELIGRDPHTTNNRMELSEMLDDLHCELIPEDFEEVEDKSEG